MGSGTAAHHVCFVLPSSDIRLWGLWNAQHLGHVIAHDALALGVQQVQHGRVAPDRAAHVGERNAGHGAGQVLVEADPPQAVTGDGEIWELTPLKCEVITAAVNILVPA